MLVLGLQQSPMGGIVCAPGPMMARRTGGAVTQQCAVSIVVAGGYMDNVDREQEEGGLWYTGRCLYILAYRRQLRAGAQPTLLTLAS